MHRAVKLVAENVAASRFLVYEGAEQRDPHLLLDLLARPNPRQEGAAFLESVCAHLLLAGNAYIEAVMVEGAVRELYALRPDRMRVVPGADGWPEAYDYVIGARLAGSSAVAVELSLLECPAFALTMLHALWIGHEVGINGFASLSALWMTYFGARFGVLGVYVSGRTREKQAGTTGELPPTAIGQLIKALAPSKKK